MNHNDHVHLLRKGIPTPGGVWADLGSGSGAFTLALADLIGPTGHIYSVDKDQSSLREQERVMRANFPKAQVDYIHADFTHPQRLPQLDGIVMANSLHYVRTKEPILELIRSYLKPGGHFILVEYNADRGNPWVPYPLSYSTWEALAQQNSFSNTTLLERVPSRFLNEIYSALSTVVGAALIAPVVRCRLVADIDHRYDGRHECGPYDSSYQLNSSLRWYDESS